MRKLILIALVAAVTACQQPPGRQETRAPSTATAPAASSDSNGPDSRLPNAATPPGDATEPARRDWREVTIPAGTRLPIRLEEAIASDTSRVEEPVRATLLNNIVVRGQTVVPAGSGVAGVVTEARQSGRVKGRATLGVRFDKLEVKGAAGPYAIRTGLVTRQAPSTKGRDAAKIGVPAIGGVVLGGIFGGKKGAIIGGTVAGGAGTAVVLTTRGAEVRLPRGTHLAVTLLAPVTVRVPV